MNKSVIVFSGFLKPGEGAHVKTMLKYIGTREGVILNGDSCELIDHFTTRLKDNTKSFDVTKKQTQLIENLLSADSSFTNLDEYDDYLFDKNMYTASSFISEAVKLQYEKSLKNSIYMRYISERPGSIKNENMSHGLFDQNGIADIEHYELALANHNGNVWFDIISMTREQAQEQSMDEKNSWENLLRKHMNLKANLLGINEQDFKWVAAFHDESYHPHVHVMYWDKTAKNGFQSKEALETFRSKLTNDIYRDELWLEKEFKNETRKSMEDNFRNILSDTERSIMKSPNSELVEYIQKELQVLSNKLSYSGSRSYGYQSEKIKEDVNKIVESIISSDQLKPIIKDYLASTARMNSYYLKSEEKIQNSVEIAFNKLVNPEKNDRKVLQNELLKTAYLFRKNYEERSMLIDSRLDSLNVKLQYPEKYVIRDEKTLIAVAKVGIIQEKSMDNILHELNVLNTSHEDKNMEILLKVKDSPELYEFELKRINRAFNENLDNAQQMNDAASFYHQDNSFACTKLFQNFVMSISNERNAIDRESLRLSRIHREDEQMIRKAKLNERRD